MVVKGASGVSGHYFSFAKGGDPSHVVDRFEAREIHGRHMRTVTFYRNGPVGSTNRVNSATATAGESYTVDGNTLIGPVTATVLENGDISWSHGYISRKEGAVDAELTSANACEGQWPAKLGSTPSNGNPPSSNQLNTELNNVARNTDDTRLARSLVAQGADLSSTNGHSWRHTPLHQAAFHGRYEMAKTLVELGSRLDLHSNPCGRGATGTPIELARGGGHHKIAAMLEEAAKGGATAPSSRKSVARGSGTWRKYTNIDMCFQGDAEIIGDWKKAHTIDSLKALVEEKNYSAVCVGSFGHAALKNFDYQLTKEHCRPSQGYTNELHVWFPSGARAKPQRSEARAQAEALAQAAWDGDLVQVRTLLEAGAPADTEAHSGFSNGHHSALNGAARNGHAAIVSLLLEQPTRPDLESRCQGPWEVTPLQQAAFWGRADVAKILLAHGASTACVSGPGFGHKTAKQIAADHRQNAWAKLVALIDAHDGGDGSASIGTASPIGSTGGGDDMVSLEEEVTPTSGRRPSSAASTKRQKQIAESPRDGYFHRKQEAARNRAKHQTSSIFDVSDAMPVTPACKASAHCMTTRNMTHAERLRHMRALRSGQ